jgi:hypothetical protein
MAERGPSVDHRTVWRYALGSRFRHTRPRSTPDYKQCGAPRNGVHQFRLFPQRRNARNVLLAFAAE